MSASPPPGTEVAEACVPNMGPLGQRRRMRLGVQGLAFSALVAAGLVASGVGRPWRLLVLPLFWAAATGVFQAREKT